MLFRTAVGNLLSGEIKQFYIAEANMSCKTFSRIAAAALAAIVLASSCACGDNKSSAALSGGGIKDESLRGEFAGAGASTQKSAVEVWSAGFMSSYPNAKIAYDPSGSGAGVNTFLTGATVWAGSDSAMSDEQLEKSKKVCGGTKAFQVPAYISPIAIIYNLEDAGLNSSDTHINMSSPVVAKVFSGEISKWNDEAIKAENKSIADRLPDIEITPVWRSDKSGTVKNFQDWLKQTSEGQWPYPAEETWPAKAGQGAKGTAGVISTIHQAQGTIGFADASQAGNLGTAAIKVGNDFVSYSSEAAAKTVDLSLAGSEKKAADSQTAGEEAAEDTGMSVKINRKPDSKEAYPLILISYIIACRTYSDSSKANFTKNWFEHILSEKGQQVAADNAGSAPISEELRKTIMKTVESIEITN